MIHSTQVELALVLVEEGEVVACTPRLMILCLVVEVLEDKEILRYLVEPDMTQCSRMILEVVLVAFLVLDIGDLVVDRIIHLADLVAEISSKTVSSLQNLDSGLRSTSSGCDLLEL
jgi:hypothetical protein